MTQCLDGRNYQVGFPRGQSWVQKFNQGNNLKRERQREHKSSSASGSKSERVAARAREQGSKREAVRESERMHMHRGTQ